MHFTVPKVSFQEIEKLKPQVRKELEETYGDSVDLRKPLREYVEGLGRIHLDVRKMCDRKVSTWKSDRATLIAKCRQSSGADEVTHVYLATFADDEIVEKVMVFDDPINRLGELEIKNRMPTYFSGHYVTGQLSEE